MYSREYCKKIIECDEDGNIILEQRSDGFKEENTYYKGKLVKQVTTYPNGIIETEHYAYPKED